TGQYPADSSVGAGAHHRWDDAGTTPDGYVAILHWRAGAGVLPVVLGTDGRCGIVGAIGSAAHNGISAWRRADCPLVEQAPHLRYHARGDYLRGAVPFGGGYAAQPASDHPSRCMVTLSSGGRAADQQSTPGFAANGRTGSASHIGTIAAAHDWRAERSAVRAVRSGSRAWVVPLQKEHVHLVLAAVDRGDCLRGIRHDRALCR